MGPTIEAIRTFSRRSDRFQAHRLLELVQTKRGLRSDRIANDRGNFIDSSMQALRHIQARNKILKVRAINPPELLHRHHALDEPVFPHPRMPDTRARLFGLRSNPDHAPSRIQVPGNETKLVRTRIK